jgi:hypothetical protein
MPHILERAPTGRAKCRGCGGAVARHEWRFGERLPNPFDEKGGEMTHWFHLTCGAYRRPEPFLEALSATTDAIDDRETLEAEAKLGAAHHRVPRVSAAERASSGRATCRACKNAIDKDTWRISLVFEQDGRFVPSGFVHIACAPAYFETTAILPRLRHFSPGLTDADVAELTAALGQG